MFLSKRLKLLKTFENLSLWLHKGFMCLRGFCSLVYSFVHLFIQQIFLKMLIVSRIVGGMLTVIYSKEKWKIYSGEIPKTECM